MAGVTPERPFVIPHLWVDPNVTDPAVTDTMVENVKNGVILIDRKDNSGGGQLGLFTFSGSSAGLFEFRSTSVYCIPVYPKGSEYFEEFGDFVSDVWFPRLSAKLKFICGRDGIKVGVISHAANLKPQPIPGAAPGVDLGFKNGLLVTLMFGAVPSDIPVWLESCREIIENHKNDDFWEISFYDANDYLKELSLYCGWPDWPQQKYFDPAQMV